MHVRGYRRKREVRLTIRVFLPLLLWYFSTLCAAGPPACYQFYPSGQGTNPISPSGFYDTAETAFPPHSHAEREEICCNLTGKRYAVFESLSSQVEKPLAREETLAWDPLVSSQEIERLCSTHTFPIYLLDSALLI